jgi:methylated-DNA-[protein]-cysteine S-methyltransferase
MPEQNKTKNYFIYSMKKIKIGIAEENNAITGVFFGVEIPDGFTKAETPLIKKAAAQIEEYLNGKRK